MVNSISSHSYLKSSCLQVFLYTDIDNLLCSVASKILQSSFDEPVYVIVAHPEMGQSLKKHLLDIQTACAFYPIGQAKQILECVANKQTPDCLIRVYDEQTLAMHLFQLLMENKLVKFQKLSINSSENYALAKKLAQDMLSCFDHCYEQTSPHLEELRSTIFQNFPNYFFVHEVIEKYPQVMAHVIWVGFSVLPFRYFQALRTLKSSFYALVPTLAYLGDVLSEKQQIIYLKNLSDSSCQTIEKEHPLISSFAADYRQFYRFIADFADCEIFEEPSNPQSALDHIKESLRQGLWTQPVVSDESLICVSFCDPYQECLFALSYLQKKYEQERGLIHDDIAILTDKKELYGPVLNALGVSLDNPVSFGEERQIDPLWQLLERLFVCDIQTWKQNEFLDFVIMLMHVCHNLQSHKTLQDLLGLLQSAHMDTLLSYSSQLKGVNFLKRLHASVLKASVFDLFLQEESFENNFIDLKSVENFEKLSDCLNLLIRLFEMCESYLQLELTSKMWVDALFCLTELLSELYPVSFSWKKICLIRLQELKEFDIKMPSSVFAALFSKAFQHSAEGSKSIIPLISCDQIPSKKYKIVIYLGANPRINSHKALLWDSKSLSKPKFYEALWLQHATCGLYYSYLLEFPDKSIKEPMPWLSALQQIVDFKKVSFDLAFLDVKTESIQDFLPEHTEDLTLEGIFELDISNILKYFKDEESFLKKHMFGIQEKKKLLDLDIDELNLLVWKMKKTLKKNQKIVPFMFKDIEACEPKNFCLRSRYVEKQDVLSDTIVLEPLKVEVSKGVSILATGLSDEVSEKQIIKKKEKILTLIALLHQKGALLLKRL